MSEQQPIDPNQVTLFAETNFRNQRRRFGIKLDDRRRHMYIIGKTGMGKTTLLENMVLSDIYAGHGLAYIDPHGDTAERLLDFIPPHRINDVVYFNPSDMEYPVGFNILETVNDEQKHLVGSGLMGVFKKIWPDVWSPRMEYILLNCVLALLDFPGATLLGINRLLVDEEFRKRVITKIRDPIVKTFWVAEFSSWSEKYATEAIAPVQNKVGQFLSASIIRNIVAQVKSTIDPRDIMDHQKIFIVNLSKGRIGEDNMRLLGGMIVTKLQLAAMERVDIPEEERKDFFMYVDEFQNFATPSFANILSEARKYRLSLILAHQYIEQLDEVVRDAVFGNIGTIVAFRVGAKDGEYMETEFTPTFTPEDLANIPKYGVYLKLMVDGVSTAPFSASTLAPIAQRTGSQEKVVRSSRERYSQSRKDIEEKVLRWSGMMTDEERTAQSDEETSGTVRYPVIETDEEKDLKEVTSAPQFGASVQSAPSETVPVESKEEEEFLRFSPERLAAITSKSGGGQKKKKPMFPHTCSRCGKVWQMPVKLDPSRPMYCSECMPIVREEKKLKGNVMKAAVRGKKIPGLEVKEEEEKSESDFDKAMDAIEKGAKITTKKGKVQADIQNKPRIVVTDPTKYESLIESDEDDEDDASALIDDIAAMRGGPVLTNKKEILPKEKFAKSEPREERPSHSESSNGEETKKKKRKRKRNKRSDRDDRHSSDKSAPASSESDQSKQPSHPKKKEKRSIESFFEEAEKRHDESKDDEESSGTVFRNSSSVHRPASQEPKPVKQGERIKFD